MFGWFRPRCPVEPDQKSWTEQRMAWLTRQFGLERLHDVTVILPTPEYFPDPYAGTRQDAKALFERVCRYMDVDSSRLKLRVVQDDRPDHGPAVGETRHQGAAGTYRHVGWKDEISISEALLGDPMALVGTMAHELGHVHLLTHGRISEEEKDHEPLTDLLTVFLGLGIFTANSVIREHYWTAGGYSGWSVGKQGYLTGPMYAYAFALFAWVRGEASPAWASHLRLDVRSPFWKGLQYLRKTGDSTFKPRQLEHNRAASKQGKSPDR
jgi:hypothetical protein